MMRIFKKSLKARLIGIFLLPLLAIFFLSIIYYPLKQLSAGREAAEKNARLLSEMLAFSAGAGLSSQDFELVKFAFNWACKDNSVVYVQILDETNSPIIENNNRNIKVDPASLIQNGVAQEIENTLITSSPIVYKDRKFGYVIIGVTLESVLADINSQILWSTLFNGVMLLIGILLVVSIIRILVRDIRAIQTSIDNADLNTHFSTKRIDEMGQLQNSFDRFVESIRNTLHKVTESTVTVTGASVEISTSIEQMAAGAQEQTSQTEEVAKAVGKMAESVVENSKNACQAAEISLKTKDAAEKGGQIVQETVKRMKDIAGIVQKCETVIQKLGDSSDKIGSIVQVIDHITDQTNLLALNAAIEAARAGEHGRGFSVVADEVKKLSEQTSKSTNEIAAMINSIQLGTSDAIQMMGQTSVQVDGGIELAERAGFSLFDIVQIAQQSTDMVHQIASASEEQSATSLQISKSMEAIALVTHQTASGSEQIARTAEDLNKLTESLNNLVGQFKLTSQAKSEETNLQIKRKIENQSLSQYTVKENGSIHNLSKQKTTYHKSTVAQNQLI